MGYHYVIKMRPNIEEASIKYATTCQNLNWINNMKPYRVEYLGNSEDDIDGLTENLLLTGLNQLLTHTKAFEKILSDFLTLLEIEDFAFAGSGLEHIIIPSNVKSIGFGAFMECEKLKSVIFLGDIKDIPYDCFLGCFELKSITLSGNIINRSNSIGIK